MYIKKINGITLSFYLNANEFGVDPTSNVVFNFPVGMQYKTFHRINTTFYATSISSNNISSYDIYYSPSGLGWSYSWQSLQIPGTISNGSTIYIEATASSTASLSQISLVTDLANGISFSSKDYFYPRTGEYFTASTLISDEFFETNTAIVETRTPAGGAPGTVAVIYSTPISGNWEVIVDSATPDSGNSDYYGVNDRSTGDNVTPALQRQDYSIATNGSQYLVYENTTAKLTVANYSSSYEWFKISGSASGPVGYVYFYINTFDPDSGGTWSLIYSSTKTYSLSTKFYLDVIPSNTLNGIYKPPRLRQL